MATPTYIEEFYDKFEQPQINRLTVGFSGIDPQQKTLFEAAEYDYSKLTPAQQKVIEQMIASYVSKLSIRIDSGNVDPATPEPEPPTVTLRPSEIPHEDLAGLLGGDKDGHYHLTDEQHERLTAYPAFDRLIDDIADDLEHNSLKGLQGGTNNEYYHLKRSDFEALAKLIAALLPNGQTVELPETIDNHEELIGLLGGDLSGHYHLTKGERDKLSEYPDYDDLAGDLVSDIAGEVEHNALKGLQGGKSGERYHLSQEEVNKLAKLAAALMPDGQTVTLPESGTTDHEVLTNLLGGASTGHYHLTELELNGLRKLLTALIPSGGNVELPDSGVSDHEQLTSLMGGNSSGHYHMTEAEHTQLDALVSTLMPDGQTVVVPSGGTDEHEALNQLMGGNTNGHYHLTETELVKLQKIIAVLFPAGADDPTFPDTPYLPGDLDGGLPAATPPEWVRENLPDGYEAYAGVHKMYYGRMVGMSNTGFVILQRSSYLDLMSFTCANNVSKVIRFSVCISRMDIYGTNIMDVSATDDAGIYMLPMGNGANKGILCLFAYNPSGTIKRDKTISPSLSQIDTTSWNATCYASQFNKYNLAASADGWTVLFRMTMKTTGSSSTPSPTIINPTGAQCGISVNPGCAAWEPDAQLFVVAGAEGTATSADGITWETHTDTPLNLKDLTFREDIGAGNLFAWCEEDRRCYISNDGITWVMYGKLPPLPSSAGASDGLSVIAALDYNPDLKWYCAVGGTSKYAFFSKDLKNWIKTTITNGTAIEAGSVIWMPSAQKYVLMPTSGTYYYTFSPADWEGMEMPENNTSLPEDTGDDTGNEGG